jgi:hypothetical protein
MPVGVEDAVPTEPVRLVELEIEANRCHERIPSQRTEPPTAAFYAQRRFWEPSRLSILISD